MSNASLLTRLQNELAAYERKERSAEAFRISLVSTIEALEAAPYSAIQEMRRFEHLIEVGGFSEEADCVFDRYAVGRDLRSWIDALAKKEANQPPQQQRPCSHLIR